MGDFLEASHGVRCWHSLELCFLITLTVAPVAEIPDALIASNEHDRAVHGNDLDCCALGRIL